MSVMSDTMALIDAQEKQIKADEKIITKQRKDIEKLTGIIQELRTLCNCDNCLYSDIEDKSNYYPCSNCAGPKSDKNYWSIKE